MTRRLLHASFLASGALFIAGIVLAASCRPLEGQSGVHVTVALAASGWTTTDQFDHITVTATSGSLHAVVCLSTVQGAAAAFDDAGYRDGGSDPCADRTDLAWTTVPTASTWHLDQAARTVNFDFPEDSPVDIVAEAHLGGLPAIGTATGHATSSIGGNTADLRLARVGTAAACAITYGPSAANDASTAPICDEMVKDCLCAQSDQSPKDCLGAGPGLACNDAGTQLVIDPAMVPTTCPTEDVGRGIARATSNCLLVATTVRMYRCVEGNDAGTCTPTADCVPPTASIVVRVPQTGQKTADFSLSCLPPTVFGIPISTKVDIPSTSVLNISWIGFDVTHSDDPQSCRVDIDPVTFTDCGR